MCNFFKKGSFAPDYIRKFASDMNHFAFLPPKLLSWFDKHRRDLPWRETNDPYKIWISEIILQQTRVAQGLDYYHRFIRRFPDIPALAEADEQEVLLYWQGLGYYSRARNLHQTAKFLKENYQGHFPADYQVVLGLKGIGQYTAAAITSFAWNMPYPVVDGNVFRFLSRLFEIDIPIDTEKGKKYFTQLAGEIMPPAEAGRFNQAIMEFGALQCIPGQPDCAACPFTDNCLSYAHHTITNYPVKSNKTKTREVYLYYFYIRQADYTYLKKRTANGIWKNLFEFPAIVSDTPLGFEELSQTTEFINLFSDNKLDFRLKLKDRKHVLSHRILFGNLYELELPPDYQLPEIYIKIKQTAIGDYPIHRLMEHFIQSLT